MVHLIHIRVLVFFAFVPPQVSPPAVPAAALRVARALDPCLLPRVPQLFLAVPAGSMDASFQYVVTTAAV